MLKLITLLIAALAMALALAGEAEPPADARLLAAASEVPPSKQIEKELQRLSWSQFKAVVEAVPKIRADIDAYGPAGWDIVRSNYRSYGWKKSIDKLDDQQKRDLVELIEQARSGKAPKP